jgi:hypothetical protein
MVIPAENIQLLLGNIFVECKIKCGGHGNIIFNFQFVGNNEPLEVYM